MTAPQERERRRNMNRGFDMPRLPRQTLAALLALAFGSASSQAPAPAAPRAPAAPTAPVAPARALPPMATPAAAAVFPIRGFVLEGENPIGEAEANRVLAPFVR